MRFGRKLKKLEKGYRRRKRIYMPAARQLWRDIKYLKSVVNVERKYLDSTFNTTVSTTENFQLLNGMTQGTSGITRTGQSIKIVSCFVRFYMTMNSAATTTQVRIFILKDSQPNAAVPTAANLLQDSTNILSPLLIAFGRRFKIFYDRMIRLDTNKLNQELKYYLRLRFHTEYGTGNTGTISDISKNSLYIMLVSDQAVNLPTVQFWARVRFIDN